MPSSPRPEPAAADRRGFRPIAALLLALLVAGGLSNVLRKDVTRGFDEVAHVSYVAQMQRAGGFWPDFDRLVLLDPGSFAPTREPNYLNHPPPYYWLMARAGPTLTGRPEALTAHRAINLGLLALGFAALLALGQAVARSRLELYAFAVPLLTIPTLNGLAGAVSNDNLALAGAGIALLGLQRLIAGAGPRWLGAVLAGIVLAGWAKLTALMLVGGCALPVLGYLAARRRLAPWAALPAGLALALAAMPYAALAWRYGSPAPEVPGHLRMLEDGARAAGWDAVRLSPPAYLLDFATLFVRQFMPTLAERGTLDTLMLALPVTLMGLSLAGAGCALARCLGRRGSGLDVLAVAGWAAILAVLAVHLRFGYLNHLATGWRNDAYPRYYLPLAGVTVLACFCLLESLPAGRARRALLGYLALAPLAFAVLGAP